MCSVVGCDSWRRSAQRFKLPEDPERRLEWIQFIAEVNKQRFKESSWTDITVCSEHFKDDCFDSDTTVKVQPTLKPGAVPSLCPQSDETESSLEPHDQLDRDAQGSPIPSSISYSTDTSDAFISVHGQMHPENTVGDLIGEKAALLQKKGKYDVNEKRPVQLINCNCPTCGGKLHMEKVSNGVLIILNQQCLQCEYRNQWMSQVSAPTTENEDLTGGTEVTPETKQAMPTDDTQSSITGVPEIVAVLGGENDPTDEEESSDPGDMDSDEDWKPEKNVLLAKVPKKETDDEDEEEEEQEEGCEYPAFVPSQSSQLCTECGKFFSKRWRHTCEHKIKPYPCNFCGKRCVSEVALNSHSRIHDANYEHRCKYCHMTFKIKVDKHTHEQTHVTEGKPYKCTDCSETFATNKERRIHLAGHRGLQQLKCDFCGIEFLWPLTLQRHLAVHTGERPFKCSVCQRGFNQAGHLKSHMRLHTGERPYKCKHCDKCFNHNVSLKTHFQRYHTPNSGCEENTKKTSNTGDAVGNGNKRGADSGLDNKEDEDDTEEDEIIFIPNKKRRGTGRPIGRPKRSSDNPGIGQCSKTRTGKPRGRKKKRTQCSDENELSGSEASSDSAEEEEERRRNTGRSRGRPKKLVK
ncbi:Zinc finger protein 813 [Collichthys lucidus]|uniref:Zinc finger protein 813 n=1 Tax=Collichthys lucidus TaxID=240159 RepID=A0A4U5UX28_COLLU|nr:Zinc finger protein 813 [Collichthys lucidus]